MFRVQAHVFRSEGHNTAPVGRLTFSTTDYKLANTVAGNVQFDEGYQANIDFDMNVRIGRRSVWVDCNPHCLEAAAEVLMQAAHDVRRDKTPLKAYTKSGNGAVHHEAE